MRHVSGGPIVGLLPILILVGTAFLGSTEQVLGQSPPSDGVKAEAEPATNDDGPAGESAVGTAESPEDRESAAISEAAEQAAVEAVLGESERWAQRLSGLIDGLGALEKTAEDADALYFELTPVLQAQRQELREALTWARSPSACSHSLDPKQPSGTLNENRQYSARNRHSGAQCALLD